MNMHIKLCIPIPIMSVSAHKSLTTHPASVHYIKSPVKSRCFRHDTMVLSLHTSPHALRRWRHVAFHERSST